MWVLREETCLNIPGVGTGDGTFGFGEGSRGGDNIGLQGTGVTPLGVTVVARGEGVGSRIDASLTIAAR